MKRVLITGSSGLIGRHLPAEFAARGYEILAPTSRELDLLNHDQSREFIARQMPTHLAHFAWHNPHGPNLDASENLAWIDASVNLFNAFREHGGKHAFFAGSCAEYDWTRPVLREDTPTSPSRSYAKSKLALRARLFQPSASPGLPHMTSSSPSPGTPGEGGGEGSSSIDPRLQLEKDPHPVPLPDYRERGMGAISPYAGTLPAAPRPTIAWGRIFFVYGPGEKPTRLAPSILHPLLRKEPAIVRFGHHIRDFLHAQDVARAAVHLLEMEFLGTINIASGNPVTLEHFGKTLARLAGAESLLKIEYGSPTPENPLILQADISRLQSTGFTPAFTLATGLQSLIPPSP